MRALVVRRPGGPDALVESVLPDPAPGPHDVVVAVEAAGVNFIDVYQRSGTYPTPLPFVGGMEGAGRVIGRGAEVTEVGIGDRVGWVNVPGAYAEQARVPASRVVPLPNEVDAVAAASTLLQGMTAHYLTTDAFAVRPGCVALVHAAAGGVGLLLTQAITAAGGEVIGVVSTAAKEHAARAAGAGEVLRYGGADLAERVRALTEGAGVDVVYDGVGAPTFDASLAAVRRRGVLVVFGQAGGAVPPFDLRRLNLAGSVSLLRPNLDHYIADRHELCARAEAVLHALVSGQLRVRPPAQYRLSDAPAAHAALEGGGSIGKLVLVP